MSSRIVISDPHGCYKTLMALMKKLPKDVPVTFAGDLVDRGPNSKEIVEVVKNGGYDCTMGNHEDMMVNDLKFRTKDDGTEQISVDQYHSVWMYNGGSRCLDSYLKEDGTHDVALLKEHAAWMKKLPVYIEYPEVKNDKGQHLLVSHTTAAEAWDYRNAPEGTVQKSNFKFHLMWERNPFPPKIDGIFNIYGHTPQENGPTIKDHFACVDAGCYFKRARYGKLVAVQFPEMIVYEQENIED